MSFVIVSLGSARNSSQVQRAGCAPPSIRKSHSSSGVCGVGPAERTGKSSSTYWPGGTRPSGPSLRRRPLNPRETIGVNSVPSLSHTIAAVEEGLTGPWLAQRLGVDPIALEARRRAGELVAVRQDGSADWIYPAWQFDEELRVKPEVERALAAAREARLSPAQFEELLGRRVGLSGGETARDLLLRGDPGSLLDAIKSARAGGRRTT